MGQPKAGEILDVPRSWNKLLNLTLDNGTNKIFNDVSQDPFDEGTAVAASIKEEDLFITFEAYPAPEIAYQDRFVSGTLPYHFAQSSPLGGYRSLHPNSDISERISHTYNNDSSTFSSAVNKMADKINSVVSAWSQATSSSTEMSVYDVPVLWANSERREFTIILSLFAYDDLQRDVYDPINWFRKNSYPRLLHDKDKGRFDFKSSLGIIRQPPVWKIKGGAFKTFNSSTGEGKVDYGFYTLKGMSTQFNDQGKFFIQGFPMFAKVSLTFEECIKTYSNFFEDKDFQLNINVKANEVVQPTGNKKTLMYKYANPLKQSAQNFIKSTSIYRLSQNIKERAMTAAITFTLKKIQESGLYKKFNNTLNMDLVHLNEMKQYTKQGFKRPDVIEPAHDDEVKSMLRKTRG